MLLGTCCCDRRLTHYRLPVLKRIGRSFRNASELPMVDFVMIYALGPFRLDTRDNLLFRGREPLALGRRAIALLRALVRTARRIGYEGRADRSRVARPGGRGEQPHGSDRIVAQGVGRGSRRRPLDRDHAPPPATVSSAPVVAEHATAIAPSAADVKVLSPFAPGLAGRVNARRAIIRPGWRPVQCGA